MGDEGDATIYLVDEDSNFLVDEDGNHLILAPLVIARNDGDGADPVPAKRSPRLFSLGGIVGLDIPVQPVVIEQIRQAQKAVRQAVKATIKKTDARKALEKAADAILAVQDVIPQTDWESLWRAYLAAQTAQEHEARVRAYARAEMQAQAMVKAIEEQAAQRRRLIERDEDEAIIALLLAA